jgi:hypothetical protein
MTEDRIELMPNVKIPMPIEVLNPNAKYQVLIF